MAANSMLDADRFLLAAPHGVDRDLIETCAINLSISDKIAIRYAFRCYKIAADDAERARIAAAASPGSADIPTETLKDVFERRHAFSFVSRTQRSGGTGKQGQRRQIDTEGSCKPTQPPEMIVRKVVRARNLCNATQATKGAIYPLGLRI